MGIGHTSAPDATRWVWYLVPAVLVATAACAAGPQSASTPSDQDDLTGAVVGAVGIQTEPPVEESLPPIYGYGDFSGEDYFAIDPSLVLDRVIECARDQQMAVAPTADEAGVDFGLIQPEQRDLAAKVVDACYAGLNLPPPRGLSREEFERIYAYQVKLYECLESLGQPTSQPPTLETFIEQFQDGPWSAYDELRAAGGPNRAVEDHCPQHPPGGYASWDPESDTIP